MGSIDPSLDFWVNASPEQRSLMAQQLAQQQQQGYAQLNAAKLQQATSTTTYSHGWTDPTLYVFGGNDPQKAYTAIQNTPEELHKHLMGFKEPLKPVKAMTKIVVLAVFGLSLMAIPVILKFKGVI